MRDITISDWSKLGSTVRAQRSHLRLSQSEAATRANVSRSWLARVEAGHRGVEFEQMIRLLEALGLTMVLRADGGSAGPEGLAVSRAGVDQRAVSAVRDQHRQRSASRRKAWSRKIDPELG